MNQFILFMFIISADIMAQQEDLWTTFTAADGLLGQKVNAIIEASDGALWLGTYEGISRFKEGAWTTFSITDGLARNNVKAICETADGDLWFGTTGVISRYSEGVWNNYPLSDPLADVTAICETHEGELWFGTEIGIIRYESGVWTRLTLASRPAGKVNAICTCHSYCETGHGLLDPGLYIRPLGFG